MPYFCHVDRNILGWSMCYCPLNRLNTSGLSVSISNDLLAGRILGYSLPALSKPCHVSASKCKAVLLSRSNGSKWLKCFQPLALKIEYLYKKNVFKDLHCAVCTLSWCCMFVAHWIDIELVIDWMAHVSHPWPVFMSVWLWRWDSLKCGCHTLFSKVWIWKNLKADLDISSFSFNEDTGLQKSMVGVAWGTPWVCVAKD